MFYLIISKSSLVEICLSGSNYSSISFLTRCLHLASVSESTDGILYIFIRKSKFLYNRTYEAMNTSNEWGEFLVILNQYLNSYFLQHCLSLHFLWQVKWFPFVSHWPFLHGDNGIVYVRFEKISALLLQTMQVNNYFMYGYVILIEVPHGLSKCQYFTKYRCSHFLQVDLCKDCVLCCCVELFYLLLGNI